MRVNIKELSRLASCAMAAVALTGCGTLAEYREFPTEETSLESELRESLTLYSSFDDGLDADSGPNNLQNFPVLTTATSGGGDIELSSTTISANDTVSMSSLTYTAPL